MGGIAAVVGASIGTAVLSLATRLVEEVGPRPAGSAEARLAQEWVGRELVARGWAARTLAGATGFPTTYACRPGERRAVVLLLAHTDTVHPDVAGANDNAAAVAVLLTAIERLPSRPERTVCVAFPDAEEVGLLGSEGFARFALAGGLGGPIDQVMALDLVGQGRLTHNGLGPTWGAEQLSWLLEVAPAEMPWVYRGVSWAWPHRERSDHSPFTARGVVASHLMARGPSGVFWAYHTPADTPEVLDTTTLSRAVRLVRKVARARRVPRSTADPAVALPTGQVLPGWLVWAGAGLGFAAGLGSVGQVDRTWLRVVAHGLGATAAFAVALLLALRGRSMEASLAGPALLAAWAAWGAVAVGWPWAGSHGSGRALAVVPAALALLLAVTMGPILALPLAVSAVAVALSGRLAPWLLALPAMWPVGFLVRPDAVRELAFHYLVPASPLLWAAVHGVLALPLLGLVQGRWAERTPRRLGAAVALVAVSLGAVAWAWGSPEAAAPYLREGVRWPGAP